MEPSLTLLCGFIFLAARFTYAANDTALLLSKKDVNPQYSQPRWFEDETTEYKNDEDSRQQRQQQQPQIWFDEAAATVVDKRAGAPRNPYSWMAGESYAGLRGYFDQKRAPAVRNPYSWMATAGSPNANTQLDHVVRFLKRKRAAIRNPYSWMAPVGGMVY